MSTTENREALAPVQNSIENQPYFVRQIYNRARHLIVKCEDLQPHSDVFRNKYVWNRETKTLDRDGEERQPQSGFEVDYGDEGRLHLWAERYYTDVANKDGGVVRTGDDIWTTTLGLNFTFWERVNFYRMFGVVVSEELGIVFRGKPDNNIEISVEDRSVRALRKVLSHQSIEYKFQNPKVLTYLLDKCYLTITKKPQRCKMMGAHDWMKF